MIEYSKTQSVSAPVKVKLDGRVVGTIKPVKNGWQYFPRGQKIGGKVFETLRGCKQSIEYGTRVDPDDLRTMNDESQVVEYVAENARYLPSAQEKYAVRHPKPHSAAVFINTDTRDLVVKLCQEYQIPCAG